MENMLNIPNIVNTIVFAGIGIVAMLVAFIVVDLITPQYRLWREVIEKQNIALSILLGAFLIGTALIIAAAVHG